MVLNIVSYEKHDKNNEMAHACITGGPLTHTRVVRKIAASSWPRRRRGGGAGAHVP